MERAFAAAGVDSRCLTVDVPPEKLAAAIAGMDAMGFRGAVLAAPHQQLVGELLSRLTPAAEALGEVDLIYRDDTEFVGANTIVRAVTEIFARITDLTRKRVVVLGTGTIARAASLAVVLAGAERLTIVARDDVAAEALGAILQRHGAAEIQLQAWVDLYLPPADTDIVVQAAGIASGARDLNRSSIDYEGLHPPLILLDSVFNPPRTALIRRGEQLGCTTVDGLELLVQRASVGFQLWTNVDPDVGEMREAFEEFLMI